MLNGKGRSACCGSAICLYEVLPADLQEVLQNLHTALGQD
jgi:hypothetical protein